MAIHKKKKISTVGDCSSNTVNVNEVIQVDFEALPLCEEDRTAVQEMLKQQFAKFPVNLSLLTNHLLSLHGIGSVLKQVFDDDDEEEEDCDDDEEENDTVFGLSHVVNLTLHKGIECVDSIRNVLISLIEEHVSDDALKNNLRDVFSTDNSDAQLAFVINARLAIFPGSITYQIFKCLFEEITKCHYNCSKLIFMGKIFKPNINSNDHEIVYVNVEDRIFSRHASLVFDVKVTCDSDTPQSSTVDSTMLPYQRIVIINSDKIPGILSDLQKDM